MEAIMRRQTENCLGIDCNICYKACHAWGFTCPMSLSSYCLSFENSIYNLKNTYDKQHPSLILAPPLLYCFCSNLKIILTYCILLIFISYSHSFQNKRESNKKHKQFVQLWKAISKFLLSVMIISIYPVCSICQALFYHFICIDSLSSPTPLWVKHHTVPSPPFKGEEIET